MLTILRRRSLYVVADAPRLRLASSLIAIASTGVLTSLCALIAGACTSGEPALPTNDSEASGASVTFHRDVAPILARVCIRCHVDGGNAPFALTNFTTSRKVASAIVEATKTRRMPPWGAQTTSECTPPHPWKDDLRLSDREIATIEAWHLGGDIEGSPLTNPTAASASTTSSSSGVLRQSGLISAPTPPRLANALSLTPALPFKVTSTDDNVECFLLNPKIIGATKYLNGTFFLPENTALVHHALAFAIPPAATVIDGARAGDPPKPIDQSSPYECFGGPRIDGARLIASWAPGNLPAEYPPNVGLPLEPGTRFVMQLHYHPHHGNLDPDATTFQYRLSDTKPAFIAMPQILGSSRTPAHAPLGNGDLVAVLLPSEDDPLSGPELLIPHGKKNHVETMRVTIPEGYPYPELHLAALSGHMHLTGNDEKVSWTSVSSGRSTCLFQDPAWSFDWMRDYVYDAPVEQLPVLRPGDTLDIRCTYDNSGDNWRLATALSAAGIRQPIDIKLGESSLDEMCQAGFLFLRKAD